MGVGAGVLLTDGGHDLGNYLVPVAQRLGPGRVAAVFGRKIHGPSSLAVGPARPGTAGATPQFSTRIAGSHQRNQWRQRLHDRLAVQAAAIAPGPAGLTIALRPGRAATGPASASRSSTRSARCWAKTRPGRSARAMTVSSAWTCITPPAPASPAT